jgi:hydrogenase maturation protein HypF
VDKLKDLLAGVVADIRNKVPVPDISLKFHYTMAEIVAGMCKLIARESNIKRVALSGGVFQNRLLLRLATAALKREGFEVLTHRLVPANDGGIALGQAVVANFATGRKDHIIKK